MEEALPPPPISSSLKDYGATRRGAYMALAALGLMATSLHLLASETKGFPSAGTTTLSRSVSAAFRTKNVTSSYHGMENVTSYSQAAAEVTEEEKKEQLLSKTTTLFNVSSSRAKIGSWVGNNWIPPSGWKLYSMDAMRRMFGSTSLQFVGDSTARRFAVTMHMILDSPVASDLPTQSLDDNNVLDDKLPTPNCPIQMIEEFGSVCHVWNATSSSTTSVGNMTGSDPTTLHPKENDEKLHILSWQLGYCLVDTISFLYKKTKALTENSLFQKHAQIVVFGIGTWHEGNKDVCGRYHPDNNYTHNTLNELKNFLVKANDYQKKTNKTLIWRTAGFFDVSRKSDPPLIHSFNQAAMNTIDSMNNPGLTYINYGDAVEPRSFGALRVTGGHVAHYGFDVRHVEIQMLANHLVELQIVDDDDDTGR